MIGRRLILTAGAVAASAIAVVLVVTGGGPAPDTANLFVVASGGTSSCARSAKAIGFTSAGATTKCDSINAARQAAGNGDVVEMEGGAYRTQNVAFKAGSSNPVVTIRAARGSTISMGALNLNTSYVRFSGAGASVTATGLANDGTTLGTVTDVTIEDLKVDHRGAGGQAGWLRSFDGVTWRRVDIGNNNDGTLVQIDGETTGGYTGAAHWTIDQSTFHDSNLPSGSGQHTECLWLDGTRGFTLTRSHFYRCAVFDLFFTKNGATKPNTTDVLIENDVFEAPTSFDQTCCSAISVKLRTGGDGNTPAIDDWTFRNNTLGAGFDEGNDVDNPISGAGLTVVDNVVMGNASCRSGRLYTSKHNLYGGKTCGGTGEVSSTPAAIKAGFAGPTGAPMGQADYTLRASSPAVDIGDAADFAKVDFLGHTRPSGKAPDAGAYEYGAS